MIQQPQGQPTDVLGTGLASFLNSFGNEVSKERDKGDTAIGKAAFEKLKADYQKQRDENPNKVRPQNNPNGPQKGNNAAANQAMNNNRKVLKAVQDAENKLSSFRSKLMNSLDTTVDHTHYNAFLKENLAKGMPVKDAINNAVNQAYTVNDPDGANLIVSAHKNGLVAKLMQNQQLANEFPTLNAKYGQAQAIPAPKPAPLPQRNSAPSPQGKPMATPGPQSMAPKINIAPQPAQPQPPGPVASLPSNAGAAPQAMPNVPTNTPMPGQGEEEEPSV